jgi:hypothetical protein
MPVIKYYFKVLEDEFSEVDIFPPVKDMLEATTMVEVKVLNLLKAHREKLGEPSIHLTKVVILNPYKHLHTWKKIREDKFACKAHYTCTRCGITGWTSLSLFNGESVSVTRNENYHASKYEYCNDPLAPVPKEIKFYGGH